MTSSTASKLNPRLGQHLEAESIAAAAAVIGGCSLPAHADRIGSRRSLPVAIRAGLAVKLLPRMGSARLFHQRLDLVRQMLCHLSKPAGLSASFALTRKKLIQRKHQLASNLCAPLSHRRVLSSPLICWIKQCQQVRTKNWESSPKVRRAI